MYGVRLFEEEKYFPMYTVQDGKFKNLETGYNGIAGIPDPGWSKNVNEKAENALVIEDCIRVFARHCDEMNLYASSQKALKDITRLLNTGDVSNQMIRAFGVQSMLNVNVIATVMRSDKIRFLIKQSPFSVNRKYPSVIP